MKGFESLPGWETLRNDSSSVASSEPEDIVDQITRSGNQPRPSSAPGAPKRRFDGQAVPASVTEARRLLAQSATKNAVAGPSRIARNQDSEHIVDERPLKRQKTLDDVEKPPRGRPSALKSTLGKSTTSRQSSTSKGPVVINLVSSDEDEEVEDDSSPPTTSRATQIAKKSTGGMKPRRTSPATGPETSGSSGGQSSDSPPTSRSTKLLARKSTGGRGPTRFQPMPEKSTSSGSGSDSDSSSSSGASIIPDTALIKRKSRPSTPPDPTRSISQGSKPRPTSTQDLPGPSSISAPLAPSSSTQDVIIISSDEDEPPSAPNPPSRTPVTNTSRIKVSESAKANRIAPITTTSSISTSFAIPPPPTKPAGNQSSGITKGKEKVKEPDTSWGDFAEGLSDLLAQGESASAGPSTLRRKSKGTNSVGPQGRAQSSMDVFVTRSPKQASSTSAPQPRPSSSTSVLGVERPKTPVTGRPTTFVRPKREERMVYTPPDTAMDVDQVERASSPDMRPMDVALGLSTSFGSGPSQSKGKGRAITPPTIAVKEQPISPKIPSERGQKRSGPPPPPRTNSLADAMNGIAKQKMSGFGTKDSPLELMDSDDEDAIPTPPPPLPKKKVPIHTQANANVPAPTTATTSASVSVPPPALAPPVVSAPAVARAVAPSASASAATAAAMSVSVSASVGAPGPSSKPTAQPSLPPKAKPSKVAKVLKEMIHAKGGSKPKPTSKTNASSSSASSAGTMAAATTPAPFSLAESSTSVADRTGLPITSAPGSTANHTIPSPSLLASAVSVSSVPLGGTASPEKQSQEDHFSQTRMTPALQSRSSSESVSDQLVVESAESSSKSPSRASSKGKGKGKATILRPPPVSGTGLSFGLGTLRVGEGTEDEDEVNAMMNVDAGPAASSSRGTSPEIEPNINDITTALDQQGIQSGRTSRRGSSPKTTPESDSTPATPAVDDYSTDPGLGFAGGDDDDDDDGDRQEMAARLDVVVAKTASEVKARPTYGGFDGVEGLHIITFEDWRAELRANPPDVRFARDIPTAAADRANLSLSRGEAVHGLLELFQAYIQEHTQDEPDAPPVEIINDIDPELEPIPPWEFHYSNMMWHSAEVPIPDLSEGSLGACDCRGRCDPKSKTCSCVKRQHEWRAKLGYEGPQFNDFRYGANGKIKDSETLLQYPIFECNALCGCDADCRNRVVQNGRRVAVSIKKTKGKGWGVFAGPKKIPKGQFLGIYSGELLSSDESQRRGEVYNKTGRTYLFDLDFHHLNVGEDPEWEPLYTVDAYHAGNFTRFLNHSCDPNVLIHPCYVNEGNINKPLLTMFTSRDIAAYEEICFDYAGGSEFSEEQKKSMEEARKSGDAIYERCLCQAANCRGFMF